MDGWMDGWMDAADAPMHACMCNSVCMYGWVDGCCGFMNACMCGWCGSMNACMCMDGWCERMNAFHACFSTHPPHKIHETEEENRINIVV
jgi:hypothetical protein